MKYFNVVVLLFLSLFTSLSQASVNAITPGQFITDPTTLHCLGFRWYVDGDDNGNATVQVTYKEQGTSQWKQAIPMLRVNREVVDQDYVPYTCDNLFAGSIMGLNPATGYDVNFVLVDPDGGQATQAVTVQTCSAPIAPVPTKTLHVYPPGWSGDKNQPSYDTLGAAFTAVKAGEEILLYPGIHTGNVTINKAGTAIAPIVIKGAGPGEAIVRGIDTINNGKNLEITGSKYLYFENITVEGGVFGIYGGGTNPVSGTKNLVVRNCVIRDVEYGIRTYAAGSENWYIADNTLIGRDPQWYPRDSNGFSTTGICVYGRGHVICYNHVEKFWDCLTIAGYGTPENDRSLKCVAIDMYGNDLSQARDDCIETDFGCHNIRVWGNRLRDAHVAISCQPVYGGPVYLVRNELYGLTYTPYKLHNWPSGLYIINNTSVDCNGFKSDEIWQNATLRNNLIIGTLGYTMETGSPDPRTTLDYDGYRKTSDPDRFIKWKDWRGSYTKYASLSIFYTGIGHEQHGIMVDFNTFRNCPVPVVGQTHNPNDYDLRLAASSAPIDKGLIIPTISENYNGAAPDIGCYEYGDLPPHYGPRGNDFYDYAQFANQWGQTNCSIPDWCDGMDFDKNTAVDWADLASLADLWLHVN